MDNLEALAEKAMSAYNKKDAKIYILQMNVVISDVIGPSRNILSEMISAVDNATGNIHDKTRNMEFADQQMSKARMFCVEK